MAAEYKIVSGSTPADLTTKVNTEIASGFEPVGNVSIDTRKIDPVFIQGLYKSA